MTTDSAKKACVFCNGQLKNPMNVKQIANDCDLLIAADGGAKYFPDTGLTPQVIIGDMDSIDSDTWENKSGIEYIRYPADKNKSDAELAVEYALKHGNEQVILVAATVSARIIRTSHPLYLLEAEIIQDGEIKATAKGKFYDQPDLVDVLGPFS